MAKKSTLKPTLKKKGYVASKKPLPIVKKCSIDFFYYDEGAELDVEGEVKFEDAKIIVSYAIQDGGYVVFHGVEKGRGHYELIAPNRNGKATLHMFEQSTILEGYCFDQEDDCQGMWRIRLI